MKTPVISVILPVYNGARYIEESIQSILDQSFTDWELIIYDAASKDNTLEVLEKLWARTPKLQECGKIIRSSVKDNVPKSLNLAFAEARGEFFTWTSDDNRYLPDAFQKMLDVLRSTPDVGVVYAMSHKIDSAGARTGLLESLPREHLVYGNNIGLCFLYRREVQVETGGYDENMFLVEDYDFWMRASQKFKFYHLKEALYEIRYHGASLTSNNNAKMTFLAEDVFERDFVGMKPWLPNEWKIRGHLRLIRTGLAQHKWKRVLRHSAEAFAVSPLLLVKESVSKLERWITRA